MEGWQKGRGEKSCIFFDTDSNACGRKICFKEILFWPWFWYCVTYLLEPVLSNCLKLEEYQLDLCHMLQHSLDNFKKPTKINPTMNLLFLNMSHVVNSCALCLFNLSPQLRIYTFQQSMQNCRHDFLCKSQSGTFLIIFHDLCVRFLVHLDLPMRPIHSQNWICICFLKAVKTIKSAVLCTLCFLAELKTACIMP